MGNDIRDGASVSRRLLRVRPGLLQFGNHVSVPISGSQVQVAPGQVSCIRHLHRQSPAEPGRHGLHALRRPEHRHRDTLLGVDTGDIRHQHHLHFTGESAISYKFCSAT